MRAMRELTGVEPEAFRNEILASAKPIALRGVAQGWPLVRASRASDDEWLSLLARNASEAPVGALLTRPHERGRFHYTPDGRSLNFVKLQTTLPSFLRALSDQSKAEEPHAIVLQGLRAEAYLLGFDKDHRMPLVPEGTEPRIWIGNASKVATHKDPADNMAVVVAGRRRFTLFPPESEGDLYLGPSDVTPAGTRVSMVHVTAPDLERYPRFASALDTAEETELLPGDAVFIPKGWYHHVEALEPFNMLVNYWWDAVAAEQVSRNPT